MTANELADRLETLMGKMQEMGFRVCDVEAPAVLVLPGAFIMTSETNPDLSQRVQTRPLLDEILAELRNREGER